MKTSTHLSLSALMAAMIAAPSVHAEDCEFEKIIDQQLDLGGSSELRIAAAAGDLRISGSPGATHAVVRGRVCASKAEWAEASNLFLESGSTAEISVHLPDVHKGMSWGDRYVYMDLEVEVPESMALDVRDSSGSMDLRNVGALEIHDSSGDIEIDGTSGPVRLRDSSGGIYAENIGGDFTVVSDSSGEIDARNIEGSVLVEQDSSGDLEFRGVKGDVMVERDSSGSIRAVDVTGSFTVLQDSSGDIIAHDVAGEIKLPRGKG